MQHCFKKVWWGVTSFILVLPYFFANADVGGTNRVSIPNPLGANNSTIEAFISALLKAIFPIATLIATFFMIYSGFLFVTAGTNEEKRSVAKQNFLWTVIGIAILLGAEVLALIISGTITQLKTGI